MNVLVKMNNFQEIWRIIEIDAVKAVKRFGESGWYILGDEVKKFESEVLQFFPESEFAVGCANGLDALQISLQILGLKLGEEVITTPLSAFATTMAIVKAGGKPVFIDVDKTGLIDLKLVDIYLSQNPQTKFLLPVHLFGHALNLKKLKSLQEKYSLKIVEDCAQAIGASNGNYPVGSVGQVNAVSFYPTKNLGALGDGGAILTSSKKISNLARSYRDYGQTAKYQHDLMGFNSRLDEIQAAIMRDCFLPRLENFTKRRKAIAKRYRKEIQNKNIEIPPIPRASDSVFHLFPVLVPAERRQNFRDHLNKMNIESGIHYPMLISDQKALLNFNFAVIGTLENAQHFCEQEVSLPIHPTLTKDQITSVIEACNAWH